MSRISGPIKNWLVLAALTLTLLISAKSVEKLGDNFQIAMPVIALACAFTNGQVLDFSARYLAQFAIVQGSKFGLGGRTINRRPNGGSHGMPSGHAATAVFGASNLVHQCVSGNIFVKVVVVLSAAFVAGSRIYALAHTLLQVLIGALVGWAIDRAFRRVSPLKWLRRLAGRRT